MEIVADGLTEVEAFQLEREWIREYEDQLDVQFTGANLRITVCGRVDESGEVQVSIEGPGQ